MLVPDQAVALNEDPRCVSLAVAGGGCHQLDGVVLAAGNQQSQANRGAYFPSRWHPEAMSGLSRKASVLLIGTGLMMASAAHSLLAAGHKGPIHAFSRHGLLPHAHGPTRPLATGVADLPKTTSVSRLARWLRSTVRTAEAQGYEWRDVIDGLRPHVQDLWRRLPIGERRRFIRHLHPWWEMHRHRLAPCVAAELNAAMQRGQLIVGAGRIMAIEAIENSVLAQVRRRGSSTIENLEVARAINCSGPEANEPVSDWLIQDLLARGFARRDPLGLGLEVSEQGALLNKNGEASRRLFAVGPVTLGTFWEITAVPDIRLHCVRLANHLSAAMRESMQGSEAGAKTLHPLGEARQKQAPTTVTPEASLNESATRFQPEGSRYGGRS